MAKTDLSNNQRAVLALVVLGLGKRYNEMKNHNENSVYIYYDTAKWILGSIVG